MSSKLLARLESIALKEEQARNERLADLAARIAKEKAKTKELTIDDEGIADVISILNNTAEKNGVSVLKLIDFAGKQTVGSTFKAVFRRARVPKAPKVVTAPKAPAAKKSSKK